jgi:hypothetical protein
MISTLNPRPGPIPQVRRSSILGPNGQPVSLFLYPTPRFNLRAYKPRYWLGADTKTNFGEYDRWEAVNYSRQLYAQIDPLGVAIDQKNSWAFGDAWDAHYTGRNAKWGEEASEFLKLQFFPLCNVRGELYDLKRSLRLSGQAWDVDGDDAMILTQSESGFPQVAFFPGTRIGMTATGSRGAMQRPGEDATGTVSGGPFDGAKIFDGVIMNRNMRMIGLRIVKEDGTVQDISSYNADLGYEPTWCDQGRGIPRILRSLLKWMNLQDIDEFLQRGMKRAAAVGLKFKTEEGEAGLGNEIITTETDTSAQNLPPGTNLVGDGNPKVAYEEIEGGEAYYFNSTTGEDVEEFKFSNPHPNSEKFIERVTRAAIASVGWLYELLDLTSTGRAPTRLACDIANQSIWDRQSAGYRRWKRMVSYAIAKGMKEGFISRNEDGIDPYLWEPGLPKQLSVDAGNDLQAAREDLKMGMTSHRIEAQKRGYHRKEIERDRLEEVRDLVAMAKQIHAESPEVPFERAMDLLEQRSPNPVSGQVQSPKAKVPSPEGK